MNAGGSERPVDNEPVRGGRDEPAQPQQPPLQDHHQEQEAHGQ